MNYTNYKKVISVIDEVILYEKYISPDDLRDYEFQSMDEYWEYVDLSFINGQKKQVQELINDCSIGQLSEALFVLKEDYCIKEVKKALDSKAADCNSAINRIEKAKIGYFNN